MATYDLILKAYSRANDLLDSPMRALRRIEIDQTVDLLRELARELDKYRRGDNVSEAEQRNLKYLGMLRELITFGHVPDWVAKTIEEKLP